MAEVGQGVTELVRKLEAILGAMNVLGRQADRDAATWRSLEIGLRMIGPAVGSNIVISGELVSPISAEPFGAR